MPASLLDSQFEALEAPDDAIAVTVDRTPDAIVAEILKALGSRPMEEH
jgi:gluconate kinase